MASLPDLDPVTQLSPYITRILGQNPGKFTLQGTNSYLLHHPLSPDLLLVDTTGPSSSAALAPAALSAYTSSLQSALAAHPVQPARVSDILLTHWHTDHVSALPAVLDAVPAVGGAPPPRVWKMPCTGSPEEEGGKDAEIERSLARALRDGLVQPAEDEDGGGQHAVRALRDGQRFVLAGSDEGDAAVEVEVVHTPGHTSDSICLLLHRHSSPPSPSPAAGPSSSAFAPLALFTADTILGHGSSVFSSLGAYMSSLSALLARLPPPSSSDAVAVPVPLYPGHGAPVADARAKVAEYAAHRSDRENQVIAALQERVDATATVTAGELTEQIYGDTIPASLVPAATHGLLLHLAKLQDEGRVARVPAAAEVVAARDARAPPGWWDGWRWRARRAEAEAEAEGEREDSVERL
ncbi:hypothetical protein JCM3770_001382 [Rhodotorula araucariae]